MYHIAIRRRISRSTFFYYMDVDGGRDHWVGRAQMVCKPLEAYRSAKFFPTDDIYDTCIACGVKPGQWIGHLRIFYPNGDTAPLYRMRMGVGGEVFCAICSDLMAAGGRLLYALPTTESMRDFLQKKGLIPSARFPGHYFYPLDGVRPDGRIRPGKVILCADCAGHLDGGGHGSAEEAVCVEGRMEGMPVLRDISGQEP
ncbi:hypothetical protein OOT00_03430 [Desulfobotulus sp. H1]|uniref:Uncharacterized protein n=1 Tax=Desulfobotulus pelophilus TaxID=2823377 RepID=A0ABT3N6F6_9BACT|nr:hypothetical protein [Desulfobotulus pelophilus]MCW7753034.1 hypothetical protein [Desulfobotulus pelophilus]